MINNQATCKYVKEIMNERFYVPSYQRGYRWTDQEVRDLLDDLYIFKKEEGDKANYCLQPLIIKKRTDGSYEVVDGQQRLITLYIFYKIILSKITYSKKLYQIEFQARPDSEEFLNHLERHNGEINDSNIDYYYITKAYLTMQKWIEDQCIDDTDDITILSTMYSWIREHVFFIWYEISDEQRPLDIFTKVNDGKISLSNSELIKALILNRSNFNEKTRYNIKELSIDWNRIEIELQNDTLWYFIAPGDKEDSASRIEYLFELLAPYYNKNLPMNMRIAFDSPDNAKRRIFLIFYAAYRERKDENGKIEFVDQLWNEGVRRLYEQFSEWYRDLNKYHIIGYLIASGMRMDDVFKLTRNRKKSEIIESLLNETRLSNKPYSYEDFIKIDYNAYANNKRSLRNLFLLVNIATLVCKNEKQYRFPFDLYKKEDWQIEHIHANGDKSDDPDGSIRNLTLLSADINESYKDKPFSDKRKVIIERDSDGKFIPICTKNVFLKEYSKEVNNMDKWDDNDKRDYIEEMWKVLNNFWEKQWN